MTLREARTARDGILYDPELLVTADSSLFDPESWRERDALAGTGGGRGSVHYLAVDSGQWVLRRYRRGGAIGQWIDESFVWFGAERTRSYREITLLADMHARGLPVPRPVAAHYQRRDVRYTADLITERIDAEPLSAWLARGPLSEPVWREIGDMVARFHAAGVWHADLTAHNILLDARGVPWLLDFDRGRVRPPGAWRERNLSRLLRSLRKIRPDVSEADYPEPQWRWLLAGYAAARV